MEAALGIITILVNRRDMKYFSEKKKKKEVIPGVKYC